MLSSGQNGRLLNSCPHLKTKRDRNVNPLTPKPQQKWRGVRGSGSQEGQWRIIMPMIKGYRRHSVDKWWRLSS